MSRGRSALLSFHTSEKELVVFAALGGAAPIAHRLAISQTELASEVSRFRHMLEPARVNVRRPERTINMASSSALMARILEPVSALLRQADSLVVSGHRHLHFLPVHLFGSGAGEPPLAASHEVAYVPNLTLLRALAGTRLGSLEPANCMAVAAAEDSDDVQANFAMAPRRFSKLAGGRMLEAGEATVEQVIRGRATSSAIYLSCHGHFDAAEPLDSYLLLADRHGPPSRKGRPRLSTQLTPRSVMGREYPLAHLVILDACLTGVQDLAPGDEPAGFPAAFLVNGASAVIASNWIVEQNCARLFMETLGIAWIQRGLTLGGAIREAYSTVRQSHPHPFHWGAFSLHGNGGLKWEELCARGED